VYPFLGDHGYDNLLPSMHPIFIARGPAFKMNYVAEPFETVDLYPLMCHLLEIQPRLNNGSLDRIKHILADGSTHGPSNTSIALMVGK
jgi:predicted AlkP superfamily pyrophosphatase or phosphodiesterase